MSVFKTFDKQRDITVAGTRNLTAVHVTASDILNGGSDDYDHFTTSQFTISASGDTANGFALANVVYRTNSSASNGVTVAYPRSAFFATQHDSDSLLATTNKIFDITVGLNTGSVFLPAASSSAHQIEKNRVYELMAKTLLGDKDKVFKTSGGADIKEAVFISTKRFFGQDKLREGETLLTFLVSGSYTTGSHPTANNTFISMKDTTDASRRVYPGGVARDLVVVGGANAHGVVFTDAQVAVVSLATSASGGPGFWNLTDLQFDMDSQYSSSVGGILSAGSEHLQDMLQSGTVDVAAFTVLKTIAVLDFQGQANLKSSTFFCFAGPNEFNYSSNPTWVDASGSIRVVDTGSLDTPAPAVAISTVGLYDANDRMLAVGKLTGHGSIITKHFDTTVSVKVRLDY